MNKLKIVTPDGKAAVMHIRQVRPAWAKGLPGCWLRSPAETKKFALRQGFTLVGKRQS